MGVNTGAKELVFGDKVGEKDLFAIADGTLLTVGGEKRRRGKKGERGGGVGTLVKG